MKLTRLLSFAALGLAAGYYLTRTEKGRQLRSDLTDRANTLTSDLRDRLSNLRTRTVDDLSTMSDDGQDTVRRSTRRVSNEMNA